LKIGDVPASGGVSEGPDRPVVFTQTIAPGHRYLYKVKAYDERGIAGKDSNWIDFMF
jgi:hypothetical protein